MTNAVALATIITIVYITTVTLAADLYLPLKDTLKNIFSHHWMGKSITSIFIFLIFAGVFFVLKPKLKTTLLFNLLTAVSILCALTLLAFFSWEALG